MMSSTMDEIYQRMHDDIEDPEIDLSNSNIRKFFAGKTLFLSGATGYVGKVFVEKILRDCPKIKRIYVLVRHKNDDTPEVRMKRYFQNVVFDKLRSVDQNFSEKVVSISGDLQEDRLGLSDEDRQTLIEDVNIIVHAGATTKFDERVSVALKTNVLGTKNMLDLAMECKHIRAFVYLSTAFAHCYRKHIEEMFHDSPASLETVYETICRDEASGSGLNENASAKLFDSWQNVYCFSKAIAERLVEFYGDRADFAVGVYRSSIATAAFKEPLAGWTEDNNGAASVFMGLGLGALHVTYDKGNPIDIVPVDFSVNCLIAIIYDLVQQWEDEGRPLVYNFGSSTLNPITFPELTKWFLKEAPNIGSMHLVWYPFMIFCKSMRLFSYLHVLLHFIPALLFDASLLCKGEKPRALQWFKSGTKQLKRKDQFNKGNWRVHSRRTMEMHDRLSEADQTIFYFDIRKIAWEIIPMIYMRGIRLYILNEPLDNFEQTKRFFRQMKYLHYTTASFVVLMVIYLAIRLLMYMFNFVF